VRIIFWFGTLKFYIIIGGTRGRGGRAGALCQEVEKYCQNINNNINNATDSNNRHSCRRPSVRPSVGLMRSFGDGGLMRSFGDGGHDTRPWNPQSIGQIFTLPLLANHSTTTISTTTTTIQVHHHALFADWVSAQFVYYYNHYYVRVRSIKAKSFAELQHQQQQQRRVDGGK